jgi:hypothetical protein
VFLFLSGPESIAPTLRIWRCDPGFLRLFFGLACLSIYFFSTFYPPISFLKTRQCEERKKEKKNVGGNRMEQADAADGISLQVRGEKPGTKASYGPYLSM